MTRYFIDGQQYPLSVVFGTCGDDVGRCVGQLPARIDRVDLIRIDEWMTRVRYRDNGELVNFVLAD